MYAVRYHDCHVIGGSRILLGLGTNVEWRAAFNVVLHKVLYSYTLGLVSYLYAVDFGDN